MFVAQKLSRLLSGMNKKMNQIALQVPLQLAETKNVQVFKKIFEILK